MKSNKFMSGLAAIACVFSLVFSACHDDDKTIAKPVITLSEVGHDNSKHAHPGHDLHLEAEVQAEGLIQSIAIEIHQEEGGSYKITQSYAEGKYIGVRNTTFHEHIDIPADAPLGKYHLHFVVTDKQGRQTAVESALTLVEDDDDETHEHEHSHSH